MAIQEIRRKGGLGAQLGAAFGQGLAEQLPKEVERHRLASGLNQIGQNPAATPYEQMSQFLSVPGMTPEKAQMLFPYLQNQMAKREQANRQQNQNAPKVQQPSGIQTQPQLQPKGLPAQQAIPDDQAAVMEEEIPAFVTPELTEAGQKVYTPPSQEDIKAQAAQLSLEEPATYPTVEDAEREILKREQAKESQIVSGQKQYERARQLQLDVDSAFQKASGDFEAKIPGEITEMLRKKAYRDVISGKDSASQAGMKYGKQALELSKDLSKIKALGGESWLNQDPDDIMRSTQALAKPFVEAGLGNLVADEVIADFGVSPQVAYQMLYPIQKDREINNYIAGLKDRKQKEPLPLLGKEPYAKNIDKITQNISEMITENTSLLATALALDERGYAGKQFLDDIQTRYENGELGLYAHQVEELKRPHKRRETLGDFWLFGTKGIKPVTRK